jgi:hypothetical protein
MASLPRVFVGKKGTSVIVVGRRVKDVDLIFRL